MMTPIETQATIEYSAAGSMPGAFSAQGTFEVDAAGRSTVAANIDDGKAQPDGYAGQQQVSIAETRMDTPKSEQAPAGTYLQPQPQPPPYAAAVQQQQPLTSASVTYPWDRQVPLSQGVAVTDTAAQPAGATAASGESVVWMPMPLIMTLCPPGLEYLAELNQLNFMEQMLRTQRTEESRRLGLRPLLFSVRNTQEQQIYVTDTLMLEMTTHFVIAFLDSTGQVRMTVKVKRGACPACYNGTCGRCALDGTVEAPPGSVIGSMEQRSSGGMSSFVIKNTEGSPVFYVEAPEPCCGCPDSKNPLQPYKQFAIISLDGENIVGTYDAQRTLPTAYGQQVLTNISVVFPPDLDIKVKATLVGAGIILHCYFFGVVISGKKKGRGRYGHGRYGHGRSHHRH